MRLSTFEACSGPPKRRARRSRQIAPGPEFIPRFYRRLLAGVQVLRQMHVRELFDLRGSVALVTGGSRGLGLEIAEGLAEAGASIAITGRRRIWLDEAAAKLRALGTEPLALEIDVTAPDGPGRSVAETAARFGGLDILINNAGISWGAPSLEYPEERWRQVIDVDLTAVWRMCQAAAPRMLERGSGRIVMVSSVSGLVGSAPEVQDTVAYSAAKAGLNGLTRDLAVKWARHGIHVNAIAPGYFPTRMTAALIEQNEAQMRALSPLGRLGREGELKGVVVFLCSRAASYVTGQILAVDGGMTAG